MSSSSQLVTVASLGGGIGGGFVLILVLVIVVCSTCMYLLRRHTKQNLMSKQELKGSTDEVKSTETEILQRDQMEMELNEAYVCVSKSAAITTEDISTCYCQNTSQFDVDTCVAYGTL